VANKFHILGFAGSLRKESYNRSLLRAALEQLPGYVELEFFGLDGIAPYQQDLDQKQPENVSDF